jgi:MFS family permease
MFLLGGSQALVFVPAMPEAIEAFQLEYSIIEGMNPKLDNKLNDAISGVATQISNVSSLFGPILGGALYDNYGNQVTMNINMIALWVMAFFFAVFSCGCNVY